MKLVSDSSRLFFCRSQIYQLRIKEEEKEFKNRFSSAVNYNREESDCYAS